MKKLSIALTILPFLTVGPVLAQEEADLDLLTPSARALNRQPELLPDWTWMREDQATQILRGEGYDVVLNLEKSRAAWRGKAVRIQESYHVAINRYSDVYSHLDQKSVALRALQAQRPSAEKAQKTMLATLNGPIASPISKVAPSQLTPGRPVATIMGEIGWTWMTEEHAQGLFKQKGYTTVSGLRRDEHGIWRASAIKDDLALRIAIDIYGNVDAQPDSQGGTAQASPSD